MADTNPSPAHAAQGTLPEATNSVQANTSATQYQSQPQHEQSQSQSQAPASASIDATMADPSQQQQQLAPSQFPDDADLDASIKTELEHPQPPVDAMNLDGANDLRPPPQAASSATQQQQQQPPNANANANANLDPTLLTEPRIPQKKDATLRDFLSKMDSYAPLIPDAVTDYYLTVAGLPPPPETDRRLARLLALATQKFIADVAADAYQYSRIRSTNTTSNNPLTGLGGAATGFGMGGGEGEGGAGGKGKKDAGKSAPLGGPRAGFGGGGAGGAQGRTVLTMEDLGMAVGEYGVNVKRGEFYR